MQRWEMPKREYLYLCYTFFYLSIVLTFLHVLFSPALRHPLPPWGFVIIQEVYSPRGKRARWRCVYKVVKESGSTAPVLVFGKASESHIDIYLKRNPLNPRQSKMPTPTKTSCSSPRQIPHGVSSSTHIMSPIRTPQIRLPLPKPRIPHHICEPRVPHILL